MSETVHYQGKLTPVAKAGSETVEDVAQRILSEKGEEKEEWCDSFEEQLVCNHYGEYAVVGGNVYAVEKKDIGDNDIFQSSANADGTIDFTVRYYNGGCSFNEAIRYAVANN